MMKLAFITSTGFLDPKKIGRVRVRFAWQEAKGDGSPWIRVMMPFATNGGGVKFNPQPDDEVMVSFEEGNVERPYVSGYLLSPRSNESWKALPDRTITSKNGHSITFNDNKDGMELQIKALGNLGVLGKFVGMLTDSRSFLSYPRHEYFRRILCNYVGGLVEEGEFPWNEEALGKLVQNISYNNSIDFFGLK